MWFTSQATLAEFFATLELVKAPCFPIPRHPIHGDFARALAVLAAAGVPYAEAWRLLRPVAARLGLPRPSYATVLRRVKRERGEQAQRNELVEQVVIDLLSGLAPRVDRFL